MEYQAKRKSKLAATCAFGLTSIMCMFVIMARSVILPTVMSELGGMDYYGITVILSSLSMSMTMPIAGKLGDIFGRKRIYCIGAVRRLLAAVRSVEKSCCVHAWHSPDRRLLWVFVFPADGADGGYL